MPENVAASLPFAAWEQAVFVSLFIVMVIGLLYWFSRQQNNWQSFISLRDDQWQKFLREQRAVDNKVIYDLVDEVKRLTNQLVELRNDFNEHNSWERGKLEDLTRAADEPKSQPRRRGSDD